ncbi:MAG: hypothetical protein L3K03_00815 [Thermoplasmata archaeon]|nr:hypothetical protein [Thermoplasmata archaeon]
MAFGLLELPLGAVVPTSADRPIQGSAEGAPALHIPAPFPSPMTDRSFRPPSRPRPPPSSCSEYSFQQRFRVPAPWAFRWCVDFAPEDWTLAGGNGARHVHWLTPRTAILDDSFPGSGARRIRKRKLVHVYPRSRSWVGTHLTGPNFHSQFRYSIVPDGPAASVLRFEGRDIRWEGAPLGPPQERRVTDRIRTEDAALWKRLARVMERDYADR